jgi:4-aminobutyrate aminotransferase
LIENGDVHTPPFMQNAAEMGEYIMDALVEIQGRHPSIAHVRGKGLMIGAEVEADGKPAGDLRDRTVQTAFRRGLVMLPSGPSTFRFCPPLNIPRNLVDEGLQLFDAALTEAERE